MSESGAADDWTVACAAVEEQRDAPPRGARLLGKTEREASRRAALEHALKLQDAEVQLSLREAIAEEHSVAAEKIEAAKSAHAAAVAAAVDELKMEADGAAPELFLEPAADRRERDALIEEAAAVAVQVDGAVAERAQLGGAGGARARRRAGAARCSRACAARARAAIAALDAQLDEASEAAAAAAAAAAARAETAAEAAAARRLAKAEAAATEAASAREAAAAARGDAAAAAGDAAFAARDARDALSNWRGGGVEEKAAALSVARDDARALEAAAAALDGLSDGDGDDEDEDETAEANFVDEAVEGAAAAARRGAALTALLRQAVALTNEWEMGITGPALQDAAAADRAAAAALARYEAAAAPLPARLEAVAAAQDELLQQEEAAAAALADATARKAAAATALEEAHARAAAQAEEVEAADAAAAEAAAAELRELEAAEKAARRRERLAKKEAGKVDDELEAERGRRRRATERRDEGRRRAPRRAFASRATQEYYPRDPTEALDVAVASALHAASLPTKVEVRRLARGKYSLEPLAGGGRGRGAPRRVTLALLGSGAVATRHTRSSATATGWAPIELSALLDQLCADAPPDDDADDDASKPASRRPSDPEAAAASAAAVRFVRIQQKLARGAELDADEAAYVSATAEAGAERSAALRSARKPAAAPAAPPAAAPPTSAPPTPVRRAAAAARVNELEGCLLARDALLPQDAHHHIDGAEARRRRARRRRAAAAAATPVQRHINLGAAVAATERIEAAGVARSTAASRLEAARARRNAARLEAKEAKEREAAATSSTTVASKPASEVAAAAAAWRPQSRPSSRADGQSSPAVASAVAQYPGSLRTYTPQSLRAVRAAPKSALGKAAAAEAAAATATAAGAAVAPPPTAEQRRLAQLLMTPMAATLVNAGAAPRFLRQALESCAATGDRLDRLEEIALRATTPPRPRGDDEAEAELGRRVGGRPEHTRLSQADAALDDSDSPAAQLDAELDRLSELDRLMRNGSSPTRPREAWVDQAAADPPPVDVEKAMRVAALTALKDLTGGREGWQVEAPPRYAGSSPPRSRLDDQALSALRDLDDRAAAAPAAPLARVGSVGAEADRIVDGAAVVAGGGVEGESIPVVAP